MRKYRTWAKQLNMRIDDEMRTRLRLRALNKRTSVAELVRTYIEWGLENGERTK